MKITDLIVAHNYKSLVRYALIIDIEKIIKHHETKYQMTILDSRGRVSSRFVKLQYYIFECD